MTDHPTRRELLRPVQLVGLAFAAAAFAGVPTLIWMGGFQEGPPDVDIRSHAVVVALIVAGIAFIVTLVSIALLMLAVDPRAMAKPVDRPVLLPPSEDDDGGSPGGPDRRR